MPDESPTDEIERLRDALNTESLRYQEPRRDVAASFDRVYALHGRGRHLKNSTDREARIGAYRVCAWSAVLLAALAHKSGYGKQATVWARLAIQDGTTVADHRAVAQAHIRTAISEIWYGKPSAALNHATLGLGHAVKVGAKAEAAHAAGEVMRAYAKLGGVKEARDAETRARELAALVPGVETASAFAWHPSQLENARGLAHAHLGLADAPDLIRDADTHYRRVGTLAHPLALARFNWLFAVAPGHPEHAVSRTTALLAEFGDKPPKLYRDRAGDVLTQLPRGYHSAEATDLRLELYRPR